jgi:hypothetical protein
MTVLKTPVDLFRAGNKSGARFDVLKPGEVATKVGRNGAQWVIARSGGASTVDAPTGLRGTWHKLAQGTEYDDTIFALHNDYPGHWGWEPARDMPLADYVAALAALNQEFVRI